MSAPKRRFTRSSDDKWVAGVCGGIADFVGWNSNLVRLLFVVSCLLPGPQVLIYLVLWLLMPTK
ncbi:PspC domain-containing protein [Nocardia sp. CNY236]|uniref:PspC domain-containing protein n=1 Tax=Nocardia sp. CNY236 TaxID=1169152 RepID=UPI000402221B|nr:PspC domain-containing protein [Nocardia sp. CNY236]